MNHNDSKSISFNVGKIDIEIQELVKSGLENKTENPEHAIELYEKAWQLSLQYELEKYQLEIIPHLGGLYYSYQQDKKKMLDLNMSALALGEKMGDDDLIAKSILAITWSYLRTQDYVEAIKIFFKGFDAVQRSKNESLKASLYINLATCYIKIGSHDKALETLFILLNLGEELNDLRIIRTAYWNVQQIYLQINDTAKAEEFTLKAIQISKKIGDDEAIGALKINLSVIMEKRGNMGEARELLDQSISCLKNVKTRESDYLIAIINRGILHRQFRKYDDSEKDLLLGIQIAERIGNRELLCKAYNGLGHLYIEISKYEDAEYYLKKSASLSTELGDHEFDTVVNKSLRKLYEKQGRYKDAMKAMDQVINFSEKIFAEKLASHLAQNHALFEVERIASEKKYYQSRSEELEKMNRELQDAYNKLKLTQDTVRDLERKSSVMAMAVTANHELNQPLMVIYGNLELLKGRLNQDDETKMKYFSRIENAVQRIENILQKYREEGECQLTEYSGSTLMFEFVKTSD